MGWTVATVCALLEVVGPAAGVTGPEDSLEVEAEVAVPSGGIVPSPGVAPTPGEAAECLELDECVEVNPPAPPVALQFEGDGFTADEAGGVDDDCLVEGRADSVDPLARLGIEDVLE